MADKKINLDFYAKVQADVDSVKGVIKNLKAQLEDLKLPAGATKNFEKSFEKLEGQIRDFESLASNGVNSLADTKKVQAAWDKIAKSINGLGFSLKELDAINDQIFPKEVSENIKKANRALEEYQSKLKEIKDTEKYKAKKAQISEAEKEVTRTRANYSSEQKRLANKRDEVTGLEKAWAPRAEEYEKQAEKVRKLNEEYQNLSNTLDKMRADKAALETIGAIDSTGKVSSKYKNLLSEREGELADLEDEAKLKEKTQEKQLEFENRIKKAQDRLNKATQYEKQSKTEEKKAKWVKEQAEAQAELNAAQKDSQDFTSSIEARKEALREEIKLMKEQLALAEQVTQNRINEQSKKTSEKKAELDNERKNETFKEDEKLKKSLDTASAQLRNLEITSQSAKNALDAAEKTVEDLNNELNNIETDNAKNEWQEVVNTLKQFTDVNLDETKGDIEAVKKILEDYTADEIKKTPEILEKLRQAASGAEKPIRNVGNAVDDTTEEIKEMDRAARDMENLKDQVLQFFSITNAIQIFKDAIRSAFETVKELDAAMTETAVVTDFSVGDMWEKLPQYADEANKLGTSIKSLYEATTLYYQQGLNSAQAMDVGIETMKMARIAGMDAAAATEAMTAALRGFNMEINEISATRINDVYSELAAITAADTSQIATAMSKTASIAASANMEFETTAALLAQIIETTQEAPETAGTAMKTIIARFTEVKQLFGEGMLTGKDSEGEEININKIDAALKKVGISLSDFLRGEKGIDDIFLELASKWDSLDLATQRYIATTAAGSRQQSRFLAMMGNYERTMELVTAANNSAGASQKQFDKTLESLDAKLQRLKNAWAEFTMGLANNELIKFGVDLLTSFVTVINKVTEALPGATGNIAKLLLTIGGLKAGGAIFDSFFQNLKKVGPEAMGPFQALTKSISSNFLSFKTNIGGLFNNIKAMGGLSGTIKTLEGAFFGLDGGIRAANMAQLGFNTTLAASPIGWIVLAIAAAIAAIYGLVKAWQAASDAFKLSAINDSINQMTSNVEGAKQAIDDLKDSKSSLKVLQREFSVLTKGTQEWKEKLIETNQQVLNLLEKYPELSAYITRTDFGTLDIEDAGWDKIIAAQEKSLYNFTNAKIGMQYMRSDLQEKMDYEELLTSTIGENFGETIDGEAIGSVIGTTAGGIIGHALGGAYGAYGMGQAGMVLGAQWGANNEKAIQDVFAETAEWGTQAILDIAGFLDTSWGKVAATALTGLGGVGIGIIDTLNGEDTLEDTAQRAMGAGFTQNEISEILAALAEAGVTYTKDEGFSDDAAAQAVLKKLGFENSFGKLTALANKLGDSFSSLTNSALKYELAKEGQRDGLMSNALVNSSIAQKDYADSVGYLLGETIYENIEPMLEQKKGALTNNKKQLKELYAQEVGGFYENGKLYSDATMATEWDLSKETMKSAIASAQIAKDMGVSVEAMAVVIGELSASQQKVFTDLFSREGTAINSSHFDSYMTSEGIDLTKILADMGFEGEDAFKQFVAKFGTDAGELLLDNFNMAADRITKARVDLVKKMRRSNDGKKGQFASEEEYVANELKNLEDKFGSGIRDTLNSIFTSLNITGDQALVDVGYQKFMETAKTGSEEDVKKIAGFVEEVDWNNPIAAVKRLNYEVKNGSALTANYAKALLEVGSSALGSGAQMQYLLQTADFANLREEIDSVIDKQGELSAMDVLNLADSYEELNDVMENTEVTAAGLAELLEKIANEEIAVDKVTDVVMAALKGFESLDSYVAKVLKNIEEFDWGSSENSVNDFMSDTWSDIIVPNIEAGRFNNSQLNKWMKLVAGSGWDDKLTGTGRKDTMIKYAKEWQKYVEAGDFSPFFARAAANQTFTGETKNVDTSVGSQYEGLDVVANKDGSYSITGYEGHDIATIESFLAEQLGVSKEIASMALVDMRQQNSDRKMDEYFTKQDLQKSLTGALEAAGETRVYAGRKENFENGEESAVYYGTRKVVDQSEIDAIVALYGEEYADSIQKYFESNAVITNFYDENGALKSAEEIAKNLDSVFTKKKGEETGAKWIEGFATRTEGGKAIIDYNQVMKGLEDANVPEQVRADVAEGMIKGFDTEVETSVVVTLSDGSQKSIEITPEIDIDTAIANAEREMELGYLESSITKAIQSAFGTDGLKINFTETSAAELTAAIKAAVPESVDTTVNYVKGSTSGIIHIANRKTVYVDYLPGDQSGTKQPSNVNGPSTYTPQAKGIKNSPNSFTALVSEEGPELIQTKDSAYLTGQNGPELAQINKGDTIYTAEETAAIMSQRKHQTIPRFSNGIQGYGGGYNLTGKSGGKSSSKSKEDDKIWENPFDKLYNLLRKIDEELHQRERLERRYEKLLEDIGVSANKIVSVSREELAHLEQERKLQEWKISGRNYQIDEYQKENSDLQKYARFVENDRGERVLRIDWDLINKVTDTDKGERIEEYVSQLEEWDDDLQEAEEALWDIEDAVAEIKERGKDQYEELEDKIKEAIVQSYQDQIDKLSNINDSINDTNAQLLDAIQSSIDKQRQDRDNQRTEDELAEKQRRLLYLQQDTSGANALEILRLQDEIEQGREDYTDTLIDQKISELQRQNDEASKQREKQITLLQAQLDHYIESGAVWDEVYSLMESGLDENNGLIRGSRLEQILKNADNFSGLSVIGQQEWWKEFNAMVAEALAYLELGRQLEDLGVSNQEVEIVLPDGSVIKGTVDDQGNVTGENGQTYNNVYQGADGRYYAGENIEEPKDPVVEHPNDGDGGGGASAPQEETPKYPNWTDDNVIGIAEAIVYGSVSGWGKGQTRWDRLDAKIGPGASTVIQQRVNDIIYGRVKAGQASKHRTEYYYNKFEHGGLADFTGPAWLDGSKSRPEIVLNPQDSRNFIQLRDILSSVLNRGNVNTTTENNGDILYDIDINVESIGSDYDVEQVANKVKSLINEDARYRNNNTVSLKR